MEGGLQIGRLFGIPVSIHHTWLIAFFLITWSLAVGFFPTAFPGWATEEYWIAGAIAALLLFVSVLVHEFSHALVAQSRGLGVRSISLFIFGGVATMEGESERPLDEFLIAIIGPITSFAIAGIAWGLLLAVGPGAGIVGAILTYLAIANAILAVFNLIPGFPLDGGRVLRAIIWGASGSLRTATNVSSYVGQFIAFGLIFLGVMQLFAGNILGGIWIAFIGWFLNGAAEVSRRQLSMQETFKGVRVVDLMTPQPRTLPPEAPIYGFVYDEVIRHGQRAVPIVDRDEVLGIVSVADVQKAPIDAWPTTPVSEIMTREALVTVRPDDDLNVALKNMGDRDLHQVLVMSGGRLVGMLTRAGVIQYLNLQQKLDIPPPRRERPDFERGHLRRVA